MKPILLVAALIAAPAQAATTLDCKVAGCANVQEPDAWSAADAAVATVADIQRVDLQVSPVVFAGVPAFAQPAPVFAAFTPVSAPVVAAPRFNLLLPVAGLVGFGLIVAATSGGSDGGPAYSQGPQETPETPSMPGEVPAVPESSTWAMLLLGFGAIGAMLRRRVRKAVLA